MSIRIFFSSQTRRPFEMNDGVPPILIDSSCDTFGTCPKLCWGALVWALLLLLIGSAIGHGIGIVLALVLPSGIVGGIRDVGIKQLRKRWYWSSVLARYWCWEWCLYWRWCWY